MGSPSPYRVLVVDDEPLYAGVLAQWLDEAGHHVQVETTAEAGLTRAAEETYDVVLLDLNMPSMDGLQFLKRMAQENRPEVVILSGGVTVRSAVEAMKLGAFDCVPKSEGMDAVELMVCRAGEVRRRRREVDLLSRRVEHHSSFGEMIAESPRMRDILRVLDDVAAANVSVLLTGESGTGKDLLARRIHQLSPRSRGPYVDVNCAALSESLLEAELFGHEKGAFTGATSTRPGLVEAADAGTLFLDEVAEMPPALQAKLLRMTEDRTLYRVGGRQRIHVDVRIVAATNRDLPREIAAGRVREDLYYRLAGVEIHVPPLRERPEDVEPLARYYLRLAVRRVGRGPTDVTAGAAAALRAYHWPGNIRELRNLMERLTLLVRADELEADHLPPDLRMGRRPGNGSSGTPAEPASESPPLTLKDMERAQIQRVLDEESWHHGRAAGRLGMPLRTLYRRIKTYNLQRPQKRA